jgi:hypothetical protein
MSENGKTGRRENEDRLHQRQVCGARAFPRGVLPHDAKGTKTFGGDGVSTRAPGREELKT